MTSNFDSTNELDLPILDRPPTGDECHNCGAAHITWQCPGVGALLRATYADFEAYKARDERIEIGMPIKQLDSDEYEYPGKIDGVLIAFYPNRHTAELALHNILAAEMPAAFGHEVLDLDLDAALVWAGA